MVKWFKENQNRLVLACGMILVAAISFAGGILISHQQKKEPLVLSEDTQKAEPLSLLIKGIKDSSISLKTDPRATVRVNEEIVKGDAEGNFEFEFKSGEKLTVYNENNIITFDLNSLKDQSEGTAAGETRPEESTDQTVGKIQSNAQPSNQVESNKTGPGETISTTEVPREGQLVGSKNSTKYHLPSCRFAKRIKPENQVWFSSRAEAESKGYQPCGTCIK